MTFPAQKSFAVSPSLLCPADLAERVAILSEAAGISTDVARQRVLVSEGHDSMSAFIAAHRAAALGALAALATPPDAHAQRLARVTRAFISSDLLAQSVAAGWDETALFAFDWSAPEAAIGLVPFVALVTPRGSKLTRIEPDHAAITFSCGQHVRWDRFAHDFAEPWWTHGMFRNPEAYAYAA